MRRLQPIQLPGANSPVARVSDLRAAGVPHNRLYASDQARPIYGVASLEGVDPTSFATRVAATQTLLKAGTFLSRRTAARMLGLPVDRGSERIDVGGVRPEMPPRRAGMAPHQIRPGQLSELPQGPNWLPQPADAWALLGAVSTVDELVVAGDFVLSGPTRFAPALCRLEDLTAAVARFAGTKGASRLREALPLLRTGVESPAESRIRLQIVRAGLPAPQTCCPVPTVFRVYHADLGYARWKIAIEYQGEYHYTGGLEQARRDNERHEAMRAAGWRVLFATAHDLRDPRNFLARLAEAIRA